MSPSEASRRRTLLSLFAAAVSSACASAAAAPPMVGGTYTRPAGAAPLFGMNIGAKHYDDAAYQAELARLDVVILGFYLGWRGDSNGSLIRSAVQQLKARNPALKVGQYTLLTEAQDDPAKTASDDKIAKLDEMKWWLLTASGAKTQWTTAYSAYEINISEWTRADTDGDRYPQWLAKRDYQKFFRPVPEFDIWYFDNVMKNSRVAKADWRQNLVDVSSKDPEVASAYRRAHVAEWQAAAALAAADLAPGHLLLGNGDSDLSQFEYSGKLNGAFIEGLMGKSWSPETWAGWKPMMDRYFKTIANLKAPALLGFNVHGAPTDYRFFRYAFTSCLLGNGHFSFTDAAAGYSSVPWFDEYEVALGARVDSPTLNAWSNGVYRRRYSNAIVLVNPQTNPRTVTVERGWRRLLARQDPVTNNGQAVSRLTIPAKDGLILVRR